MSVPYEASGRTRQKGRTRSALVEATRELLTSGVTPTVEEAAVTAGISRTTAYRYFPTQRALLMAAYPEIELESVLPDGAPADPSARLDLVVRALGRINADWEPALRAALRSSLDATNPAERPLLRGGRAIGWIEDALAPLRATHPDLDVRRLAVAIRSAVGIEALVWLVDVAELRREEAAASQRWSAQCMLRAALGGDPPPPAGRS